MFLILRINGVEIARKPFGNGDKLSELILLLKKEYKAQIEKAGAEPEFYLENVPSAINTFKSLNPDSIPKS
jgi:hypothetical protein